MITAYIIIAIVVAVITAGYLRSEPRDNEIIDAVMSGLVGAIIGATWPVFIAIALLGVFGYACGRLWENVVYRW